MPRGTQFRTLFSGCALLTACACSSPHRNLGQIGDGGADMPSDMQTTDECPDTPREAKLQAVRRATFLSDFAGTWIGQAEDALGHVNRHGAQPIYSFPSGSTRIMLEVSSSDPIMAKLTFGEREHPSQASELLPAEGFAYSAAPVASALDVERSGQEEAPGEPLALDGKLVLAFSLGEPSASARDRDRPQLASELHVRFAGDRLAGVFDGLNLLNERGFLTRPGRVHFRPARANDTL